eukprot:9293335-Prorocentrum_lima.AAC.1
MAASASASASTGSELHPRGRNEANAGGIMGSSRQKGGGNGRCSVFSFGSFRSCRAVLCRAASYGLP